MLIAACSAALVLFPSIINGHWPVVLAACMIIIAYSFQPTAGALFEVRGVMRAAPSTLLWIVTCVLRLTYAYRIDNKGPWSHRPEPKWRVQGPYRYGSRR